VKEREAKPDEDIGRPQPWSEGRYQKPGKPVEVSVRTPPGRVPDADKRTSTPVTRKDYESAESASPTKVKPDAPGDGAG
jgi:hypothetical protein